MTRRDKLLRRFDKARPFRRRAVSRRLGDVAADEIPQEARKRYEGLIDDVPYAGRDRDVMAGFAVEATELLAFALVLRRRGCSREETGTLMSEMTRIPLEWLPSWLARLAFRFLQPVMAWWLRRGARASQERRHPDEFLYEAVDGDGRTTDWGIDMRSCAICKTFTKHDAVDLVPYLCALDDDMSRIFGMGLRRTGTIALGATHCDFRYRAGGEPRTLRSQFDIPLLDRK